MSTLKTTYLQQTSSVNPNITLDSSGNATVYNTLAMGSSFLRNRIINGAMVIAQRGTSFSAPSNVSYTLDRWFITWGGAAPATVAQVTGPTGFRNAIQITGAASNTSASLYQRIESQNCSDLSGATITIQANIAVSSSQTVAWQLGYANAADNFSSATSISSGTWSATSTATTFTATVTNLPSGATNGLQLIIQPNNGGAFTSGTITITGVQLEVGSIATPFERRQYGQELALCQRYYYQLVSGMNGANPWPITVGFWVTTTALNANVILPITMRSAPTVSVVAGSGYYRFYWNNTNTSATTAISTFSLDISSTTFAYLTATSSGGTGGMAGNFSSWNSAASLGMNAEL